MPELPDVETFKRYFSSTALHQRIDAVEARDCRILKGISRQKIRKELRGRSFESTSRHGKYLFVRTDVDRSVVFHFGMTGYLRYFKDLENDPDHDRLLITFDNGYHLAFVCQRLLGGIYLTDSKEDFIRMKQLGPDALRIDFETFHDMLAGKRGSIKPAFLDQRFIAGIGNMYADEILFQSGVHPRQQLNRLSGEEKKKIFLVMQRILRIAVKHRAVTGKFPHSYLIRHRKEGVPCPRCGSDVRRFTIAGRSTYFCPRCQRRRS